VKFCRTRLVLQNAGGTSIASFDIALRLSVSEISRVPPSWRSWLDYVIPRQAARQTVTPFHAAARVVSVRRRTALEREKRRMTDEQKARILKLADALRTVAAPAGAKHRFMATVDDMGPSRMAQDLRQARR